MRRLAYGQCCCDVKVKEEGRERDSLLAKGAASDLGQHPYVEGWTASKLESSLCLRSWRLMDSTACVSI